MTTTSTFSGMEKDTKPSSRVLRPPGGGSSNIFGGEPVQRGNGSRPKSNDIFGTGPVEPTDEHRGKRRGGPSDNSRDNVFGGSTVQDSGSNTRAENKRRGQVSTYNPITGQMYAGFEDTSDEIPFKGKRAQLTSMGAYNPITGEPIESPQKTMEEEEEERRRREAQRAQERGDGGNQPPQQATHTSSRVLAPPGGKSSGPLW
ncbi:jupiter microtubule associated homolog 1 isoform X11 [Magallana gigas]|uniref:jupiter microtubule associated homolog 1 isoform X11 n=1 Tax=Magallana gigas TaxID=29159 RepID=UPI003342948E